MTNYFYWYIGAIVVLIVLKYLCLEKGDTVKEFLEDPVPMWVCFIPVLNWAVCAVVGMYVILKYLYAIIEYCIGFNRIDKFMDKVGNITEKIKNIRIR